MQNLHVNTCYEESTPYASEVWFLKIFYELFYKLVIWMPYARDQTMIIIVLMTLKPKNLWKER